MLKCTAKRQPITAALALIMTVLACGITTPPDGSTTSANLATVTPGGRVSVSLLTPTLTLEAPLDQAGEPIGPVATATAAAATAIAQTATALVPTATIPGIFTDPATCPEPGSPTLPNQPSEFSRYAEAIVQYLSAGGAPTVLEARLRSWEAINDYGGLVRADRDFTGDGVPEVIFVLLDPAAEEFPYPGTMQIYGCEDGAYRLLYQTGHARNQGFPTLHSADDVNGNYVNDLVFTIQTCDDLLCSTRLHVMEWNLTLDSFISLLADELNESITELVVHDLEGDGLKEIIATSGGVSLPIAGPERIVTTTLRWNGSLYTISEQVPSGVEYRIHVIQDADAAQEQGDHVTAMELYRQAINDTGLLSWQYPEEATYLQAYARYRMLVGYALQNDLPNAQRTHDELVGQYTLPTPTPIVVEGDPERTPIPPPTLPPGYSSLLLLPGSDFAEMARLFWREFATTRSIDVACQIVQAYARVNPGSYDVLNSFGLANPTYRAEDLCPFP